MHEILFFSVLKFLSHKRKISQMLRVHEQLDIPSPQIPSSVVDTPHHLLIMQIASQIISPFLENNIKNVLVCIIHMKDANFYCFHNLFPGLNIRRDVGFGRSVYCSSVSLHMLRYLIETCYKYSTAGGVQSLTAKCSTCTSLRRASPHHTYLGTGH